MELVRRGPRLCWLGFSVDASRAVNRRASSGPTRRNCRADVFVDRKARTLCVPAAIRRARSVLTVEENHVVNAGQYFGPAVRCRPLPDDLVPKVAGPNTASISIFR